MAKIGQLLSPKDLKSYPNGDILPNQSPCYQEIIETRAGTGLGSSSKARASILACSTQTNYPILPRPNFSLPGRAFFSLPG